MQKYTLQESGTNHGHKLVRRNKLYLQNKKSSSSSKKKTHKTDQVYVVKDITFLCFPLSRFRIWSPWTTTLAKKTSTSVSQWLSSYYYYLGTTYPPQGWPKGGGGGGLLQTVIKSYWVDNWDLMMVSDDILCWMMFIILQNTFLKLWISYIFNGLFVWYHQWSWAWSQAMAQPSRGTSWGRKMTNDLTTSYDRDPLVVNVTLLSLWCSKS